MHTERIEATETALALQPIHALPAWAPAKPADCAIPRSATVDALFDGVVEIVEIFRVEMTYRIVARWCEHAPRRRLSPQERRVLERLVRGRSQKEIGYDLGVGLTTVSEHLRVALDKLGLGCWENAVIAVAALQGLGTGVSRPLTPPLPDHGGDPAAFVLRADLVPGILQGLTVAERDVALLAADGCSNAEIGRRRRSSPRTVANQVASAFRKLRAHGRLELIQRLVVEPLIGGV